MVLRMACESRSDCRLIFRTDDLSELTTEKESRLTFLSPTECDSAPSRQYLVKGLLSCGDVACIFGAPGTGKSLLAPFLGYAVAQGREVFGMRTKPGGVFYVAAEDVSGMRGRVRALRLAHGDADQFLLVGGVSDLLLAGSPDLAALVAAVREQRPALIILDTLAMAFPGLEENSAEGMGRVIAVARRLTKWGAAVVLIHHDTKAEGATPRGHSLLNGALDVALHVKRDDGGVIRAKMTKNRNGSCDRDIAFAITIEDGGSDEDGDVITLPRCQPVIGPGRTKEARLKPSESAALALLQSLPQPVDENAWRLAAIDGRKVSAAEDVDSRRKAFKRAVEGLSRLNKITFDGVNYREEDGFNDVP